MDQVKMIELKNENIKLKIDFKTNNIPVIES